MKSLADFAKLVELFDQHGVSFVSITAADREAPLFPPQRLKQTGGGPKPRIERLVDVMFFENVGRDERQVVNGLTEFRGHASRSVGHGANSGSGGRNLPRSDRQDFWGADG
jgi:hypothetical protein